MAVRAPSPWLSGTRRPRVFSDGRPPRTPVRPRPTTTTDTWDTPTADIWGAGCRDDVNLSSKFEMLTHLTKLSRRNFTMSHIQQIQSTQNNNTLMHMMWDDQEISKLLHRYVTIAIRVSSYNSLINFLKNSLAFFLGALRELRALLGTAASHVEKIFLRSL